MRRACLALGLVGACLLCGCAATMERYADPDALTMRSPVSNARSLDIPKRFFDDELPARFQHKGIGIINDQETFLRLWAAYNTTDTTALPPSIDFENFVVLFIYDPEYYNRVFIRGLNVWEGIANPIVERTNWKLSIGGDPKMREIREKQGLSVPEPKVNVGLLELLRNKPGRPGVTAVLVEGAEDPADSLVIPVPEAP